MAWNNYTAILKLSTGELVAAGLKGVTRFNGKSWYNLVPSYWFSSGRQEDRIYDNSLVDDSRWFLADTIYFYGKQSWNLLELPNGDLLVGFKGSPHTAGGILRVNFSDVAGYITYDTTGGRLDGLIDEVNDFIFITVRHMAMDQKGNVWIANPFCELRENVLAVYTADGEWLHFSTFDSQFDSQSALNLAPTEIAFDAEGRVWVASEVELSIRFYSPGGIAVLDYGADLDDKTDDQWTKVVRPEAGHSNTVWSLVFDQNQVLWTVSPTV